MSLFYIGFSIDTKLSPKYILLLCVQYAVRHVSFDRVSYDRLMEKLLQTNLSWGQFRFRATYRVQHTGSGMNDRRMSRRSTINKCLPYRKPVSVCLIVNSSFQRTSNETELETTKQKTDKTVFNTTRYLILCSQNETINYTATLFTFGFCVYRFLCTDFFPRFPVKISSSKQIHLFSSSHCRR